MLVKSVTLFRPLRPSFYTIIWACVLKLSTCKKSEIGAFRRSEFTSVLPSQIESLMNEKANWYYNSSESWKLIKLRSDWSGIWEWSFNEQAGMCTNYQTVNILHVFWREIVWLRACSSWTSSSRFYLSQLLYWNISYIINFSWSNSCRWKGIHL